MRNRNNKYFSPSSFEQLLNNGEMEELKERLLFLIKCPSSIKGTCLISKYIFAFSDEEIRQCPPLSCSAAMLSAINGDKDKAAKYYSYLDDNKLIQQYALLYMPNTDEQLFRKTLSLISKDYNINLPLDGARPSIINGFRDFTHWGRFLPYMKNSLPTTLYKLYGSDAAGIYETALAEYYYQNNQCFEALSTIVAVLPLIQENGSVCVLLAAMFVQLHILAATGQTSSLRLLINNCEKAMSRTDYTLNKDCLNALRAWCALYDDDWSLVDDWISEQEQNAELPSLINLESEFVKIRIYLQFEQYYKAISCLEPLFPLLEYWHRNMDLCEAKLLYAMSLYALGRNTQAYEILTEVLPIIQRRRYYRLVADEGEQMYKLLRAYSSEYKLHNELLDCLIGLSKEMGLLYPNYLRRRLDKFPELTQTEKQVLLLMADERSNADIADYLDISVNTVKFHCKNIFNKLDVANRRQAIKTARELHILRN